MVKIISAVTFSVLVYLCSGTRTKFACERSKLNLFCPQDQVLKILGSNYGREIAGICFDDNASRLTCRTESAFKIVHNMCSKQQKCSVFAANNIFGDPCVGTSKYLEIKYECTHDDTCSAEQYECSDGTCVDHIDLCANTKEIAELFGEKIACEESGMYIECPVGYVVYIKEANYGRTSIETCPNAAIKHLKCFASASYHIMRNQCNGKQFCNVIANNGVFGDPCVGTHKYLKVEYECVPEIKTAIACEHQVVDIKCGRGQVIKVLGGYYGRREMKSCSPDKRAATDCASSNSLRIFQETCSLKSSCKISASNNVFGDPCVNTNKYILMDYYCE